MDLDILRGLKVRSENAAHDICRTLFTKRNTLAGEIENGPLADSFAMDAASEALAATIAFIRYPMKGQDDERFEYAQKFRGELAAFMEKFLTENGMTSLRIEVGEKP